MLATAVESGRTLLPELPGTAELRQARQSRHFHSVIAEPDGRLVIRVLTPIPVRTLAGESNLLMLQRRSPNPSVAMPRRSRRHTANSSGSTLGRSGLKRIYTVTLSLTLLLALLWRARGRGADRASIGATALIPAEGTQAVAQGAISACARPFGERRTRRAGRSPSTA